MFFDVFKTIIEIVKLGFSIFTYFKDKKHKKNEPSAGTDGSSNTEN